MTNLTGTTLSHYRLDARIGAGGMGEVYRGVDTRLNRVVAVKILPPDLLHDEDRRRRFTQEARSASALNHPNIVTIHDVGSERGIDFIVMEHVDGRTLEEIIARRPMAIGPLLRHATQVADALTAAHAAGLVHRDLKPTNIMVTGSGLVKVLDFGLAKLAEAAVPATAETKSVAAGASPTERGTIVGTASYMSPEQAEGGAVDARSDIFSFGSVLYEMATGRRAFDGPTTMATIAAVLRDEPPRISTLTAPLPHDLEVLINRCLKKDPDRRVQHMADLRVALQELKEDSESGRLMTAEPAPVAVTSARGRVWMFVAAGLLASAAVAGWLVYGRKAEAPGPPVSTRLTFDTGLTGMPALSPDGKLLAYISDRNAQTPNIWLQQVDGGQAAIQLTHHEDGVALPVFSPDGTRIAYSGVGKDEGIYTVPAIGGEPTKLAPDGVGAKFSPDGSRLAFAVQEGFSSRLSIIPAAGGPATTVGPNFEGTLPHWSADGSRLLALGRVDPKAPPLEAFDWFVVSIADGSVVRTGASAALRKQKVLTETAGLPFVDAWTDGKVLFTVITPEGADIWRVALNPATYQVEGTAEQVTLGTAKEMFPAIARDGTMAYTAEDGLTDYWTMPLDANAAKALGPSTQIMDNAATDRYALSLDGSTLFFCAHRGGHSDIRSRDLRTGKETPLLTSTTEQHVTASSADGSTFLYVVAGRKPARFLGTTAGAPPRQVCENEPCSHVVMSPDASKLLYIVEPDHHIFHLLDIASGRSTELVTTATGGFEAAVFSPDGKWVAVTEMRGRLLIVPVRDTRVDEKDLIEVRRATRAGYDWPGFSPDGATLYYGSDEDGNDCIYAQRLSASRHPSGPPVAVAHLHEAHANAHPHSMAVAADKMLFLMQTGSSNIWLMRPRR